MSEPDRHTEPDGSVPDSPGPDSPGPDSPVPDSPVPDSTVPDSTVPDGRASTGTAAGAATGNGRSGPTLDELSARIGELIARNAELEDLRLRALADLDNLRKRCAAQVRNAEADAAARVAAQWLPVVDNLERALAHAQADPGSIIEGVRAVRDQAVMVLGQLGFPRRDDLGATFDPARHEAIATRSDPDAPEGSVVEVILPAYGEAVRQLRPAQVVVAKAD